MLLRIEDTDQKRNTPTAMKQVISDLRWLGINWEEGPEVGGPNGPYLQSERLEIYTKYARQLLDEGKAYYTFDTSEELGAQRTIAETEKKAFSYRRPHQFPTEADVQKARAEGRPVTIRFAMPQNEPVVVNDILRGQVTFAAGEIGDFIIIKSDGYPTYHFACVVDDELMQVTHILRGQEHLMNTPGHIGLQRALGFRTPLYAHMSVTVSESGGKLSKRDRAKVLRNAIKENASVNLEELAKIGNLTDTEMQAFLAGDSTPDNPQVDAMAEAIGLHLPEINVVDFQRSGYIPEAMVNFIALLGWSAAGGKEIMTCQELIAAFDLERLNKTNSLFDRKKLVAFNTEHMRMVPKDRLLGYFKDYLALNASPLAQADDATLRRLLEICEGARTLEDVEKKSRFLFTDKVEFDPDAVKKVLRKDNAARLLGLIRAALAELADWTTPAIHKLIEELCTRENVGFGKIAQPIRVALTGTAISPPIADSLDLLGREKSLARIDDALAFLANS